MGNLHNTAQEQKRDQKTKNNIYLISFGMHTTLNPRNVNRSSWGNITAHTAYLY